MFKVALPINDKQKQKLKKNALDFVDKETEKKNDPKYKTELCKSFRETNFCPYGNRCRFAHGKKELFDKNMDINKYKQKQCNSFKEFGYCLYGSRCNFKHVELKLENINRSYYGYLLSISYTEDDLNKIVSNSEKIYQPFVLNKETFFQKTNFKSNNKRLDAFLNLTKNAENSSTSVSSNESYSQGPRGSKGLSNDLRFPVGKNFNANFNGVNGNNFINLSNQSSCDMNSYNYSNSPDKQMKINNNYPCNFNIFPYNLGNYTFNQSGFADEKTRLLAKNSTNQ